MRSLGLFVLAVGCWAADAPRAAPARLETKPEVANPIPGVRVVYVNEQMEPPAIRSAFRQTVAFTAPDGEQFVSVLLGDPDEWPHSDSILPGRVFGLSPSFPSIQTTLHLITDHGNVYAFILKSGKSIDPSKNTDLDVTVILKSNNAEINKRINDKPAVVAYSQFEFEKQKAEELAQRLSQVSADAQKKTDEQVASFKQSYPATWTGYEYNHAEAMKYPWSIEEIAHDDKFVYIRRTKDAQDLPTVYGIAPNGKPELIVPQYDPDRHVYVISRLLQRGYLSFGASQKHEKKLEFYVRSAS